MKYSKDLYDRLDGLGEVEPKSEIKKTAIIFLTDKPYYEVKNKYEKLKYESKHLDVFRIVTNAEEYNQAEDTLLYEHHYYRELGYTPFSTERIIPGSTYFSLLYFFKRYPDYDYYWLVEDDVWYNGCWSKFYSRFEENDADLVGAYISSYSDVPNWEWWYSMKTEQKIDDHYKKRIFYPICRFSVNALRYLDQRLKAGDHGHGEVLIPTLLYLQGFSFHDLTDIQEQLVIGSTDLCVGSNNNGTFRYRPMISSEEIAGEYLFHPVKEDILYSNKKG